MAAPISPLATTSCEPRQARKGAAAAVVSGAGVWLIRAAINAKVEGSIPFRSTIPSVKLGMCKGIGNMDAQAFAR